jgi:hypothetical protein
LGEALPRPSKEIISMTIQLPYELESISAQTIQLELVRRALGEDIVDFLNNNRQLWKAVLADRLMSISHRATHLIQLPILYQLRDLKFNEWNVDTLYILSPTEESKESLIRKGHEIGLWGQEMITEYSNDEMQYMLLGSNSDSHRLFSVWWD